jgi:hypothetical protein
MYKDVNDFYKSCDACQHIGGLATLSLVELITTLPKEPFMNYQLDFLGLIKMASMYTLNKYILVVINNYATKWMEAMNKYYNNDNKFFV